MERNVYMYRFTQLLQKTYHFLVWLQTPPEKDVTKIKMITFKITTTVEEYFSLSISALKFPEEKC